MTARYIVRLDDACPTMRRDAWSQLEEALDELRIRPIVGVIPDNQDKGLFLSPPDPRFWDRVRSWQEKGWSIALHGLHHQYHAIPAAAEALLPLHTKSEFVGLSLDEQRRKVARGYALLRAEDIRPRLFMAPSHSFDRDTLRALRDETDIRIITDGYALRPYRDGDFIWLPQQLWRFRWMPVGIWTVCLHPNSLGEHELDTVVARLRRLSRRVISVDAALEACKGSKGLVDFACAALVGWMLRVRHA
jgi:predicted deacetylase